MEDTNPKTKFGLQKAQLHLTPLPALEAMAGAFELGAKKYGAYNWRQRNVSISTYISAAERHLRAYWEGQETDPESGKHHLGHAMACMAILVDAGAFGKLVDDRPVPGVHGVSLERDPLPVKITTLADPGHKSTAGVGSGTPWPVVGDRVDPR